jgi:hypothetical protein
MKCGNVQRRIYDGAIFQPRRKSCNFNNTIMRLRGLQKFSPFVQEVKDWPGTTDVDKVATA